RGARQLPAFQPGRILGSGRNVGGRPGVVLCGPAARSLGAEALAAPAYADAAHAQDRAAAPVARGGGGSVCLGTAPNAADCLRCGPIAGSHLPHRFRDQLPLLVVSVYAGRVGVRPDDADRSRTRPALRELSRGAYYSRIGDRVLVVAQAARRGRNGGSVGVG